MKGDLELRCQEIGRLMVQKRCTIRQLAPITGLSKSTIYKELTKRLPMCNSKLAKEVREVLDQNRAEAPSRGGQAIRCKYKK